MDDREVREVDVEASMFRATALAQAWVSQTTGPLVFTDGEVMVAAALVLAGTAAICGTPPEEVMEVVGDLGVWWEKELVGRRKSA